MLILERRRRQYFAIGPDIRVFVDKIHWDGRGRREVKLYVCAPHCITILRKELRYRGQDLGDVERIGRELPRRQFGRVGGRLLVGRGCEQALLIGNEVEMFVISIGERLATFGFEAPRSISILRGEAYERESTRIASPEVAAREAWQPLPA